MIRIDRMTLLHRINWIRRLAGDRSAIAAVEFALILPLLLTLYLGTIEIANGLAVKQKVTHVSSSLGDLVTQSEVITDADMRNILDAAASVMAPYPAKLLRIKVTGVAINKKGKGKVKWSDARNDTPESKGSKFALPSEVRVANSFLVVAEVGYTHTPIIGYMLTGSFELTDEFFLRPRGSGKVTRKKK